MEQWGLSLSTVFLFQNQFPEEEEVLYETAFETVDPETAKKWNRVARSKEWPKFTSPF